MSDLKELLGFEGYKKWRKENFLEFQCMNIFANLKREAKTSELHKGEDLIFLDRGVFDWVVSLKREGIIIPNGIQELVKTIKYDYICIIEDLPTHETRQDTGRMLDKDLSDKWKKFIIQEYTERFGANRIKFIPYISGDEAHSIKDRAKLILNEFNIHK